MRNQDRELIQGEEGGLTDRHEEGEQRCAEDDLWRGEWQEDEEAGRRSSAELIAHQRQRSERAERRRDEGGDQRNTNAHDDGIQETRNREEVRPVIKGEADPGVVRLPYRVVEAKEGNDEDRKQQVDQRQTCIGAKGVAAEPAQHQPIPDSSSSVPSTRA